MANKNNISIYKNLKIMAHSRENKSLHVIHLPQVILLYPVR